MEHKTHGVFGKIQLISVIGNLRDHCDYFRNTFLAAEFRLLYFKDKHKDKDKDKDILFQV